MSVRRQNENALVADHRAHGTLPSRRLGTKENTQTPLLGKSTKSSPSELGKPTTSKSKTSDGNPLTTRRPALTSLTNGTPLSTRTIHRQPLTSKLTGHAQRPSDLKPSSSLRDTSKTPGKKPTASRALSNKKKTLDVYTPAKPITRKAVVEEIDGIEYMPPGPKDIPYEPPTPMRRGGSKAGDDIFELDVIPPGANIDLGLDDVGPAIQLSSIDSPQRRPGQLDKIELDQIDLDDFQFEV